MCYLNDHKIIDKLSIEDVDKQSGFWYHDMSLFKKESYNLDNPITSEALSVKEGRAPELPIVTRKDDNLSSLDAALKSKHIVNYLVVIKGLL